MRNLKVHLQYERKEYVLDKTLIEIDHFTASPEEIVSYNKHSDDATKVSCIMITTMAPELSKFYKDYLPYEMALDLAGMFYEKTRQERFKVVKSLMGGKVKEGESVFPHMQKIQKYVEQLQRINVSFDEELAS